MSGHQVKSSKKPWSASEDAMLLRLIEEYGSCGSWPKIALHMEWRTGKQCRERYINQLDPNIKKTPWTAEEDATIIRLHEQLGNKWSKFMDFLPGRSDNAIKNRFHVISKDNCTSIEHNQSLHNAYQNCQKSAASRVTAHTTTKAKAHTNKKTHSSRVRTEEDGHQEPLQRLPSVEEESDGTFLDLFELNGENEIDFDLGLFKEEMEANKDDKTPQSGSSPNSLSPRTTNDFGDSAGEEPYHNMSFTYSKSSTDGMSSRESPIDSAMLGETVPVASKSARNLMVAAALPVTPSDGASSAHTSSPTAVHANPSPKSKNGSPTNKANLNIETNNSLYDFDLYFPVKNGAPSTAGVTTTATSENGAVNDDASLQCRSDDSVRILQETVCWQYDPNVDLAQALEFLMSATASPAGASNFGSSSGSRPGSFRTSRGHGQTAPAGGSRSPNGSLYNLVDVAVGSPNSSQRLRPLSGNVASAASMLMRSSSASMSAAGVARVNCDPELVPSAAGGGYHNRPLPPHPPAHAPASQPTAPPSAQQATSQPDGRIPRFSTNLTSTGMPEHSPMNHTHFSPACPNSKRPRGKNPCHFW